MSFAIALLVVVVRGLLSGVVRKCCSLFGVRRWLFAVCLLWLCVGRCSLIVVYCRLSLFCCPLLLYVL